MDCRWRCRGRASAMGRFETFPWLAARSPTYGLAQIPPADLHIPILGQLAPSQLPFGDAVESSSLEVVSIDEAIGAGARVGLHAVPSPNSRSIEYWLSLFECNGCSLPVR